MDSKEENRLKAQTASYVGSIAEVFYAVLAKSIPLDRELKNFFRRNARCGSTDRHIISEGCFSLFRWYGWLRARMPGGLPATPHQSNKFCLGLAAALWLDHHEELSFFPYLLELAKVDDNYRHPAPEDLAGKAKGLGHFFKIRKLDVKQLVPEWFLETLPSNLELESFIGALQTRPPVWIRLQNDDHDRVKDEFKKKDIIFTQHIKCGNALKVKTSKFKVANFSSYETGDFEVQDLASQCVGLVSQARAGEKWWDVCAGAGGKSLLLADQMREGGTIVATDIRDIALTQLEKRRDRGNFKNITVNSLGDVCRSKDVFDGVLIDAPCSCTGVWRRNPDLRWTTKPSAPAVYVQTQLEIFQMAACKVKPGGVLVYATCSLCIAENEDVVQTFLEENKDFELDNFINPLDGQSIKGMLRVNFTPFDNDAMFIARMKKKRPSN